MSFVSFAFGLFVLVCWLLYHMLPFNKRYLVLLFFSYAFYIITCNKYVIYMVVTTITTYYAARFIDAVLAQQKEYLKVNKETLSKEEKKAYKSGMKKKQKAVLIACLLAGTRFLF